MYVHPFPTLHTVLPATMEAGNKDTKGWGVTLPIYMDREAEKAEVTLSTDHRGA